MLEPKVCPALIRRIPCTEFVTRMWDTCVFGGPRSWEAVEDDTTLKPLRPRLKRTRHRPKPGGSDRAGRGSSYRCSDRVISSTRSMACGYSSWRDGMSAHRLYVHNHTFTTAHFLPSLGQTHSGSSTGCSLALRKWLPSTGIPRRSN